MRHEIKKKLIELDLRSYELSKELDKAKSIEIDDADLEGLRKKAGDRAIVIARNALVEDIREDIKEVEDEMAEICCDEMSRVENYVGKAVDEVAYYILRKYGKPGPIEDDILKKMMNAIEICMVSLGKRIK
jgi:hypothetical protein